MPVSYGIEFRRPESAAHRSLCYTIRMDPSGDTARACRNARILGFHRGIVDPRVLSSGAVKFPNTWTAPP